MSKRNYLFKVLLQGVFFLFSFSLEIHGETPLLDPHSGLIFDGKSLGNIWKPYNNDGKLSTYSTFENEKLLIDVPGGHGWARVGIESNETILDTTQTNQPLLYNFTFKFDTSTTTAFAIELEGINNDHKHSYSNTTLLYKQLDENLSVLELYKDGTLSTKLETNGTAPKRLELVVNQNGFAHLHLPDGRYLQTTSTKYPLASKGYILKVYTRAKLYKSPAKMALKSIKLVKTPTQKEPNLSNLEKGDGDVALFDGQYFNDIWIPYNEQYKDYFRNHSSFDKEGFKVNIPKENQWGETGILSLEPTIWLDGLDRENEIKSTFSFDVNHTTGFSIVLGDLNHHWKSPSGKNANVTWRQTDENNHSKLTLKIDDKVVLDESLPHIAPSEIVFSFKNKEMSIEGDTFSKKSFSWPNIVRHRALYLFVFSHAYQKNMPVKMALKKITLHPNTFQAISSTQSKEEVNSLPISEIFGTSHKENWKCYEGKEKDLATHCLLNESGCLVTVPHHIKSSDGLKSKNNIITLDERRINSATMKIVMQFNPLTTENFDIKLGYTHLLLEKENPENYIFQLGDHLKRDIPKRWLKKAWNGRVNIFLSKNAIEVELDGSVAIQIAQRPSVAFPLQLLTTPHHENQENNATFELQTITTQWITAKNLTATQRWNLLNDEDFNPDEFLKELKETKQ